MAAGAAKRRVRWGLAGIAAAGLVWSPAGAEDGSVHHYSGDGTGDDITGGADAAWTGTEAYGPGVTPLPLDQSFAFDGASFLTVGDADAGNFGTADFTISVSARITAPGVYGLVSKRSGCFGGGVTFFDLRANRNGPGVLAELQDAANPVLQLQNPTPIDDGAFHTVTFQREGTLLRLSVDGFATTTTSVGVIDLDIPDPLRFGTSGCVGFDGTQHLIGNLDGISAGPTPPAPLPTTTTTTTTGPAPTTTTTTTLPTATTTTTTARPPATTVTTVGPGPSPTTPTTAPTTDPTSPPATTPRRASATAPAARTTATSRPTPAPSTTTTIVRPTTTTSTTTKERDDTERAAPPIDDPGEPEAIGSTGPPRPPAEPGASEQFVAALSTPRDVGFDVADVARSLWLVLLLLAFLRLPVTIVNRTLEVHADEISATAGRWRERLARLGFDARLSNVPLAGQVAAVGLAGAALFAAIQPGLRVDRSTLALLLGVLAALLTQTTVSALSQIMHIRRAAAIASILRLFPAFAVIAAASAAVSRVIGLQPGLLLGPLATVVFLSEPSIPVLGRTLGVTYRNIGIGAAVAWVTRSAAVDLAEHLGPFVADVVGVTWTTIAIIGVQALVFNMVPLDIFHGRYVLRWSTAAWAALQGGGAFALVHVLLRQTADGEPYADRTTYLASLVGLYLLLALALWAVVARRVRARRPDLTPMA